ncbi:MAG: cytochrome c nitrite reductase small subunit [Planctomycetes bacterium]|nr:cytochrome c nitrite reductase small subunit [Planctomycetota bacterium]
MLSRIYRALRPPPRWRLPVLLAGGVFAGLALFLVHVSNAFSYLSDDPRTCVNCHIMGPEYASWSRSSHRRCTHCNDCHVPQDHVVRTYLFKAQDGMRHATVFTLRQEPQTIRIKAAGQQAVQDNCVRCHAAQVHDPRLGLGARFAERWCWDCHREVPHGRTRSLSSVPNARVPMLGSIVPDFMKQTTGSRAPVR